MDKISDVSVTEYIPTIYTKPRSVYYNQNGRQKKYDIMAERNGVTIILYNKTRNTLTLVKQFRASVYFNHITKEDLNGTIDVKKYPASLGVTLEFCAGLEDKDMPTEQVAVEEIYEECGYKVTRENLEKIGCRKNLTDTTGAVTTYYYCEVTDDMRVSQGGGNAEEGEFIEVIEMNVEDVIKYANSEYVSSPSHFLYGLYWFLYNKYQK